jgi:nitrate/TMAO reductase-like tetraheme cytochrome c subunit
MSNEWVLNYQQLQGHYKFAGTNCQACHNFAKSCHSQTPERASTLPKLVTDSPELGQDSVAQWL